MIHGEEQQEYTTEVPTTRSFGTHEMVEYASKEQYQKYIDEKLMKTYADLRLERLKTEIEMILVIKDSLTHVGHQLDAGVKQELNERLVDMKTSAFSDIKTFKEVKVQDVEKVKKVEKVENKTQTTRIEPAIGLL